jgi:hypothetical protein
MYSKFLWNPIKSLIRRLQAIIHGQINHTKYPSEELCTQRALFRAKIYK